MKCIDYLKVETNLRKSNSVFCYLQKEKTFYQSWVYILGYASVQS